jgi:DNA-binding NarL/FixJ family response regulator
MCVAAAAASASASTYRPRRIYDPPVTKVTHTSKALLLGWPGDRTWEEFLRRALAELHRELVFATEATADEVQWGKHDLILLDAGAVGDLTQAISRIRARNADARIIIFSPSPSWEQAREVMLAGATDYAPRELRQANIVEVIRRGLGRPLLDPKKKE